MFRSTKIVPAVVVLGVVGLTIVGASSSAFRGIGVGSWSNAADEMLADGQTGPRTPGSPVAARNPGARHFGANVMEVGTAEAACLGLSWPVRGVIVDCVIGGCLAASAGLKVDDIIEAVNGQPVFNRVQFWSLLGNQIGNNVELDIVRNQRQKQLVVGLQPNARSPGIFQVSAVGRNPCAVCPL